MIFDDKKLNILFTLDGKGPIVKSQIFWELVNQTIAETKMETLTKMKNYFNQDAFYSESKESGMIGIAIGKYIEKHKDNL